MRYGTIPTMKKWLDVMRCEACALVLATLSCAPFSTRAAGAPPEIDGRLGDSAWASAEWKDGFAVVPGDEEVYVAIKDCAKGAEACMSPSGRTFSFYRFSVSDSGRTFSARFYSEDGVIEPDPYSPVWRHAAHADGGKVSAEFAIPYSAFYMTRNGDWSRTWLVGFARERPANARIDPKTFAKAGGFPLRNVVGDLLTRSAWPEMDSRSPSGMIRGRLTISVKPGIVGEYAVSVSSWDKPTNHSLGSGDNRVSVPCEYPSNGLYWTHIAFTHLKTGRVLERDYPVRIEFEPVSVKLSLPQYRDNFYPGQPSDRVAGRVDIRDGGEAELTLEGPGFPTRRARLSGKGGEFSFDTRGFSEGDAWLTVKNSAGERRTRVRKLPSTGRRMVWIEDGHLVVNGKGVLRRNIYSEGYRGGVKLDRRYFGHDAKELFHITPEFRGTVEIAPYRLVPGIVEREARRDVRPCREYFEKLDEVIAANRDKDFAAYYIADEPECFGISPVYLRHIYEYMKDADPYHPCFTASRAGKTYIDCVDWAETHPYLSARVDPDGKRTYNTPPWKMGDHLDAFEAWGRPDKCIGYLPTCFAYKWSSSAEDYPTLDEYVLCTWAAMMRGGKSLWPYAYHDVADRPALYIGTQYIFQSFEALQDLVLSGKRTTFAKSRECEGVLYELGDEKMIVAVNFTATNGVVNPVGVQGRFREFRGTRRFETGLVFGREMKPIELKPLETLVATTRAHDVGLRPKAEVFAEVAAAEAERKGRDNQLLERQDDIVLDTNLDGNLGGGSYKLFDGMYDQFARGKQWLTNAYVSLSFPKFTPTFRRLRLHGYGLIDKAEVSVRKRGEWRKLRPVAARHSEFLAELDFGEPVSTVKMRIDFPGKPGQKNQLEIYEIELPKEKSADDGGRAAAVPEADKGVKWSRSGFASGENSGFGVDVDPSCLWLVADVAGFRDKAENQYRGWVLATSAQGHLCGTVTHPQPGIYTMRLTEPYKGKGRDRVNFWHYGIVGEYNSISMMSEPANRVELECRAGGGPLGRGDVLKVRAVFASPCEDVAAEILRAAGTGDLRPFKVNGNSGVEMRQLDDDGRVWGAEIEIATCDFAKKREVYVRVQPLGGALKRPVLSNFPQAFDKTK